MLSRGICDCDVMFMWYRFVIYVVSVFILKFRCGSYVLWI